MFTSESLQWITRCTNTATIDERQREIMNICSVIMCLILSTRAVIPTPVRFCYYTNLGQLDPADIDPFVCTHIIGHWSLSWNGGEFRRNDITTMQAILKLKNETNPKLKILGSLKNENDDWEKNNTNTLVISSLTEFSLDGLNIYDVDSEQKSCGKVKDIVRTIRFTNNANKNSNRPTFVITMSVSIDNACFIDNLADLDFVIVKPFDQHGNWLDTTGHASPFSSKNDLNMKSVARKLVVEGPIGKGKILMAIPTYSHPQKLKSSKKSSAGAPAVRLNDTVVPFFNICEHYDDAIYEWDSATKSSYLHKNVDWLSFESKRAMCYKTSWLQSEGYTAGYIVWSLDRDDHKDLCGGGRFPIAKYLKENFGKAHSDAECEKVSFRAGLRKCTRIQSKAIPEYAYNATFANQLFTIECAKGKLVRQCIHAADSVQWGEEKNENCKTKTQVIIDDLTNDGKEVQNTPTVDSLNRVIDSLSSVMQVALTDNIVAEDMLNIVGNVINADTKMLEQADANGTTTDKIVSILEQFASDVLITDGVHILIASKEVSVGAYNITAFDGPLTIATHFTKSKQEKPDELSQLIINMQSNLLANNKGQLDEVDDNNLEIPGPMASFSSEIVNMMKKRQVQRIQAIAYRNSSVFRNKNSSETLGNSSVVSIFMNKPLEPKQERTVVTYEIPHDKNETRSISCVFWNKTANNWSTDGISSMTGGDGQTVCTSNHLSSFSILMVANTADDNETAKHESTLSYISYIGCGVSILGLLITIVTYTLFTSLRREDSGKILINICVSMLLLNSAFFVLSAVNTSGAGVCMAVSISLHYFLLTTLLWMMIEALHMYEKLIIVFVERQTWFMPIRMVAGWCIPLIFVSITAGITKDDYQPSNKLCFLSSINQTAFYVAVLAPSCLILVVNTYVFVRVTMIVLQKTAVVQDVNTVTSTVSLTQVRGAMSVMFVLGVTWVFGPLAIGPLKIVFSYLFTIFNSIQGFLVFLFRCVFNTEARLAWRYLFMTGQIKKRRGTIADTTGWASELRSSVKSIGWTNETSKARKQSMKAASATSCSSRRSIDEAASVLQNLPQ